jgi:lipid-A-disaccharide synthase
VDPTSEGPRLLLLAGEPSGDLHGAHLARALRARIPGVRLVGTGGDRMRREGVELLAGLDELAVMGFVEVLSRLPFFWRLERRVRTLLASGAIDLVLPIDYPGFNLRITERAHGMGIPVVFYIAPQVWAWKARRTGRLARAADRIAVILPFEEEIFRREGGRSEYVGHPLLDRNLGVPDRDAFCRRWDLDPDRPILAIFPGSRAQELRRHQAPFLGAAARLRTVLPGLQVALARAPGLSSLRVDDPGIQIVEDGQALLRHARAALVKSGTTTLEAALEGVPFVVAYRTHPLTYALARKLVQVEHVALANLVAGGRVVPELLQSEVTAETLAEALEPLLRDGAERTRMQKALAEIRARLGKPGAADRVAGMVEEVLVERGRLRAPGGGPDPGARTG